MLRCGAQKIARSCADSDLSQHGRKGCFGASKRPAGRRSEGDKAFGPISSKSHAKARQKRRDADVGWAVEGQRWAAVARACENSNILRSVRIGGSLGGQRGRACA